MSSGVVVSIAFDPLNSSGECCGQVTGASSSKAHDCPLAQQAVNRKKEKSTRPEKKPVIKNNLNKIRRHVHPPAIAGWRGFPPLPVSVKADFSTFSEQEGNPPKPVFPIRVTPERPF